MISHTTEKFWKLYSVLPVDIRKQAKKMRMSSLKIIPITQVYSLSEFIPANPSTQYASTPTIAEGGIPGMAKADALHVAVAAVHGVDYLLTWNCRHIDNATRKPIIRAICVSAGYFYPEICTPMELLTEDSNDVL